MAQVLVIGVDPAWWGGSRASRRSRCDLIFAGWLDGDRIADVQVVSVELSAKPNRTADEFSPLFDPDAELLSAAILRIAEGAESAICAVDAPIFGPAGKRPRCMRGKSGAVSFRECDRDLARASLGSRRFKPTLQPASPIPPRMAHLAERLKTAGFAAPKGAGAEAGERLLIEAFPAATIWSLAEAGFYGDMSEPELREYKRRASPHPSEARALCELVLGGVADFLNACGLQVPDLCEPVVRAYGSGRCFRLHDAIDAALSWSVGAAFAIGRVRIFGERGEGGFIVVAQP